MISLPLCPTSAEESPARANHRLTANRPVVVAWWQTDGRRAFRSRPGQRLAWGQVVVARAFHDHNHVLDLVLLLRLSDHRHGHLEKRILVFEGPGFDEQVPEVIGHHPL